MLLTQVSSLSAVRGVVSNSPELLPQVANLMATTSQALMHIDNLKGFKQEIDVGLALLKQFPMQHLSETGFDRAIRERLVTIAQTTNPKEAVELTRELFALDAAFPGNAQAVAEILAKKLKGADIRSEDFEDAVKSAKNYVYKRMVSGYGGALSYAQLSHDSALKKSLSDYQNALIRNPPLYRQHQILLNSDEKVALAAGKSLPTQAALQQSWDRAIGLASNSWKSHLRMLQLMNNETTSSLKPTHLIGQALGSKSTQ